MPLKHNCDKLSLAFAELAKEIRNVPIRSFDYIGDFAVRQMQQRAPVDKGVLKRGIKKKRSSPRTVQIVSEAPYSAPVDKGHKTRQGTGRAPNYKPKRGGKRFVPADPFFTSVVQQLQGNSGELIKRAKVEANNSISAVLSKYGVKKR